MCMHTLPPSHPPTLPHTGGERQKLRGDRDVVTWQRGWVSLCWRMLTDADVCWRMLTGADVCWWMLTYADGCWRMLGPDTVTHVHVWCRMLTDADGCWRMLTDAMHARHCDTYRHTRVATHIRKPSRHTREAVTPQSINHQLYNYKARCARNL
jgi:hypothetical protein